MANQKKKILAASEMIKASAIRRDRKKRFPNQILTLDVSVQGQEFFQKAFLRCGHQQSQ